MVVFFSKIESSHMLTVKQLIEKLEEMPPNSNVIFSGGDYDFPVIDVSEEKRAGFLGESWSTDWVDGKFVRVQ